MLSFLRHGLPLSLLLLAYDAPMVWAADITPVPLPKYHLTPGDWHDQAISREALLDSMSRLARYLVTLQDDSGAIIDPILAREHQYSTPYTAAGLAGLLHAGEVPELQSHAIAAMEHATAHLAEGHAQIPDGHGEFYLASLAHAWKWLSPSVPEAQQAKWKARLETPLERVIEGQEEKINNWRTYAMKGEWLRARVGLADVDRATAFVEDGWLHRTQRIRMTGDPWNLYRDWNGDPQSLAVEAVGRGNLLGLVRAGYDGPSAAAIRKAVLRGSTTALLLQSPDGQCPPNGRTDNHVFNDVLYAANFASAGRLAAEAGDKELAARFRQAADLSLRSALRWQREEGPWAGSFCVTKNAFPPEERVGYQPASQYSNYNATILFHLAELLHEMDENVAPIAAPSEIGGYVLALDEAFGAAVANSGGMQVQINLRGDSVAKYGTYWTPLGIVRFARSGWDGRLGPPDGAGPSRESEGISLGPTWQERGNWGRLADRARDYRGSISTDFVHPALVRLGITYAPVTGVGGSVFELSLVLTPDGVLVTMRSPSGSPLAMTVPMVAPDEVGLPAFENGRILTSRGLHSDDVQNVLLLDEDTSVEPLSAVKSPVGWLQPLRVRSEADRMRLFVYPQGVDDLDAQHVLTSFLIEEDRFSSVLGTVTGNTYQGRTVAGGVGEGVDLDGDGELEIVFDMATGYLVRHTGGRATVVETDSTVGASVYGQRRDIEAWSPITVE